MRVPKQLQDPKSVWAALGLIGLGWETYCLHAHNGGTASEATRAWWRTNTEVGKWAFITSFGVVIAWFPAHILRDVGQASLDILDSIKDKDTDNDS